MKFPATSLLTSLVLSCTDFSELYLVQSKEHRHSRRSNAQQTTTINNERHDMGFFPRKVELNPDHQHDIISSNIRRRIESSGIKWEPLGGMIVGEALNDFSGWSIAMSDEGSTIAVGAPDNDGGSVNSGQVRVFHLVNKKWTQVGNDIDGKVYFERFGISIDMSIDGKRVVIGGQRATNNSGVVRIYENRNDNWEQMGVDIEGEWFHYFGYSVAMSNNGAAVAVGAPKADDDNGKNSGRVSVYFEESRTWKQAGSTLFGSDEDDLFGNSVSLSDDGLTLAIGAPGDNSNRPGYARLYTFEKQDWFAFRNTLSGDLSGDQFGSHVSLSGNGLYMGVSGFNDSKVKVYHESSEIAGLVQIGKDIPVQDEEAPTAFSYDGKVLIVGDRYNDKLGLNAGRAQVFQLFGGEWQQLGDDLYSLDESSADLSHGDYFGRSVAISHDGFIVAAGAHYNDFEGKTNSGHVRVFKMVQPTEAPTKVPTKPATQHPTTAEPTKRLTAEPTKHPTAMPTAAPTIHPTIKPRTAVEPTKKPTERPHLDKTKQPTKFPTVEPTTAPTMRPTTAPIPLPTINLTMKPRTTEPTRQLTNYPSVEPTKHPTVVPTTKPRLAEPSTEPTKEPSTQLQNRGFLIGIFSAAGVTILLVAGLLCRFCMNNPTRQQQIQQIPQQRQHMPTNTPSPATTTTANSTTAVLTATTANTTSNTTTALPTAATSNLTANTPNYNPITASTGNTTTAPPTVATSTTTSVSTANTPINTTVAATVTASNTAATTVTNVTATTNAATAAPTAVTPNTTANVTTINAPTGAATAMMQQQAPQRHVFVSARFLGDETEKQARQLYEELKNLQVNMYIVDANAGQQFGPDVISGLTNMDALLAICSSNYGQKTSSSYCTYAELKYAFDHHITIFPLKLCPEWPPNPGEDFGSQQNKVVFTPDLVYCDWYNKSWNAAECAKEIKKGLENLEKKRNIQLRIWANSNLVP